jgi:hypothetical protein
MTCIEMRNEAELLYESLNSSAAPGFTASEWASILTVAQRKVVYDILKEGVTRDSFNVFSIEKLITTDAYTTFTTSTHFKNLDGTAAQILDVGAKVLDAKYFWLIDEFAKTSTIDNIKLKRISFDFYRENLKNPFRVPDPNEEYWILQHNNNLVFITDGTAIIDYYLVAVEHPDNYPIGTATPAGDCILNEGVHSKIVQEAVTLARMSITDPQGYQLAMTEFNK